MNKQGAFILLESVCALTVVAIGVYTFNLTFQQFIAKLQLQRQDTDQAQVLHVAAQHHAHKVGLTQLQVDGQMYQVQTQTQKIRVGQGGHYAEITW
ncbi:type II secretion system protein [Loigolactobacillus jiayinensis]|uniref:Type II secretion system protein n=1 Tax=Loigolactobacillus jiayinensis TaxID=2486016 RepID=A0ABW1RCL3_9LACO|nr:type II secretion system protein [Loigolactobacillus jiayinensis]